MTDEPKRSDEDPEAADKREPRLDREDVEDLTPSGEDTADIRGGGGCTITVR